MRRSIGHSATAQRGAALLIALLLLTLVTALASSMVWQQWRAIQVETAERARAQSAWILNGALDWARLILREDARAGRATSLIEPWAVPLAEARLSSFLAADRDNNADSNLEAFLAGSITDAQSRYNLRNLVRDGKVDATELAILSRLCEAAALSSELASRIANGLRLAAEGGESAPLAPRQMSQLPWLGVDADSAARLAEWVELLPQPTPINLNTASAPVLKAVLEGLDSASADRIVQLRQTRPFKVVDDARAHIPEKVKLDPNRVTTLSQHFEIRGRLRLEDRVLEERSLVQRQGLDVHVLLRERTGSVWAPR